MNRLETIAKAVVLGGLGLMLYSKISNGTLNFYINLRFAWLTLVAVMIFAALALTLVYRLVENRSIHTHPHDHAGDAAGTHQHGVSWAGVAILAIPMLVGLLVPARPLGASAITNKGIGLAAPSRPGTVSQAQLAVSGPKNILDWLRDFSRAGDPSTLDGQTVDVIGFVYRDPRNSPNQFWVSRFAITCCVADASAVGLLVQTQQAQALQNDAWVQVTGKFNTGEFAGEKVPVIIPDKIVPTDQPQNPYLYP